ncbi:hypothetical protein HOP50_14g72840 [Chloropicon primus]|uniref:Uncharacterized protein n=1 Tax=Chloropicon primus TaxID=1764295 RepID=A0A5B8MWD6_9CHLO|nr:hypothetical protein A3770_14p72650 [Chloropicon primus]UPR03953.1 hypothetical protein HOP50_14g72840 [Chloropicon primus]|eukprot:QDZ24747.1 hypothetical protein A3770_14p72650 [Chloropicon primus]
MFLQFLKGALALAVIRSVSKVIRHSDLLKEEDGDEVRAARGGERRESGRPRMIQAETRGAEQASRRQRVAKESAYFGVNGEADEEASTSAYVTVSEEIDEDGVQRSADAVAQRRRLSKESLRQQRGSTKRLQKTSPKRKRHKEKDKRRNSFLYDQGITEDDLDQEDFFNMSPPRAESHLPPHPYQRENSPEVVKIKVDLLDSLKGNLESLKENLQVKVEQEEGPSEKPLPGGHVGTSGDGHREEAPRRPDPDPDADELKFVFSSTAPEERDARRMNSSLSSESKQRARRSSAPMRYQPSEVDADASSSRQQDRRRRLEMGNRIGEEDHEHSYNMSRPSHEVVPESAPDSPERGVYFQQPTSAPAPESSPGDNTNDDGTNSSPTYIVHEKQVHPIGYRKKNLKLVKVSNDSPEWFQSKYKAPKPPVKKKVEGEEFYIPGGKQKVECRYVTQVSDSSPDWFRTKYSKTHYQPILENDQEASQDTANVSARKLSFWEDRPL